MAAAADLVERELIPAAGDGSEPLHTRILVTARHFAQYRAFYRAMLTGSCAFPMTRALNGLFGSLITVRSVRERFGDVDEVTVRDLAALITGGTGAIVDDWLIEADDPLDAEALADRLLRLMTVLFQRPVPSG
nr:hypothetical protein [Streptomyces sp. 846.5]